MLNLKIFITPLSDNKNNNVKINEKIYDKENCNKDINIPNN